MQFTYEEECPGACPRSTAPVRALSYEEATGVRCVCVCVCVCGGVPPEAAPVSGGSRAREAGLGPALSKQKMTKSGTCPPLIENLNKTY